MKAALTNESTGILFDRAATASAESASYRFRDGLTMTPWVEGSQMWRAALAKLPGATFYHCELWLEALRAAYGKTLEIATLHRAGELRAAAVLARSKGLFSTRLVALPFSDCGEPLASDDESRAEFMRALALSNQAKAIEIRGVAGPAPWQNVDCFGHWTLDIARPFAEISAGFGRTVRNGIKRARKDKVQIEQGTEASYLSRFFELQLATRRRLGIPPQPFKFFEAVREKFADGGNFEVWLAKSYGSDQAGAILLRNGDQLCYKWAARNQSGHPGANHLLASSMIEAHAGKARSIDLGRCDMRNEGLVRSKSDIGCVARPLPYAFFPKAPTGNISSEVLRGPAKILSVVWKRLPLPLTRMMGEALYRYIA